MHGIFFRINVSMRGCVWPDSFQPMHVLPNKWLSSLPNSDHHQRYNSSLCRSRSMRWIGMSCHGHIPSRTEILIFKANYYIDFDQWVDALYLCLQNAMWLKLVCDPWKLFVYYVFLSDSVLQSERFSRFYLSLFILYAIQTKVSSMISQF